MPDIDNPMDRTELVLLAAASGLVIIVAALSFMSPVLSREMTRELCEDSDGTWNECGSLCTGEPPVAMCADACVPLCECQSDFSCPPEFYCRTSGVTANETGVCAPILEGLCDTDADCGQPRCAGMHAVCEGGECRVVTEQGALTRCS